MTVETLAFPLASGVVPAAPRGVAPWAAVGVADDSPQLDNLSNNSSVSPCLASGAGSTPLRVNLSARDAKHRRAPSDTFRKNKKLEEMGLSVCYDD